jgi:F-type H+-transporting ATPase subunit delta
MNDSKISVRYAKALFETAVKNSQEDEVRGDIQTLLQALTSSEDFRLFLESPVIADSDKVKIFGEVFNGKISKLTSDFFSLLVKNKRENFLKIICLNYLGFYSKSKNIRHVTITTATKAGEETAKEIVSLIKKTDTTAKVEVLEKVDSSIIGGLIIKIDDKEYDASIRTQLKKVKEKLK